MRDGIFAVSLQRRRLFRKKGFVLLFLSFLTHHQGLERVALLTFTVVKHFQPQLSTLALRIIGTLTEERNASFPPVSPSFHFLILDLTVEEMLFFFISAAEPGQNQAFRTLFGSW